MTLAEFLAARLDEDERLAQRALEEAGRDTGRETRYPYPDRIATCMHDGRHNPARVLREVEAKRAILAEHRDAAGTCYRCRYGVPAHWESVAWPCPTIRALAAVYSDHPASYCHHHPALGAPMSHQPSHAQPHRQPPQPPEYARNHPAPYDYSAEHPLRSAARIAYAERNAGRTTPPGRAVMPAAASFWYVLGCVAFGAAYFAKVPAKKALAEAGLAEMTAAEKFWYVVMCIGFGSGYFAKLPVKKALTELAR